MLLSRFGVTTSKQDEADVGFRVGVVRLDRTDALPVRLDAADAAQLGDAQNLEKVIQSLVRPPL
jgi:hypothetical protein